MNFYYVWYGLGIARLAQGGGIKHVPRSAGVACGALIAGVASIGQPWPAALANVAGALTLMTLPHGPFLSPNTADIRDDRFDAIYSSTRGISNTEARWWAYSLLRYPGVAALWSAALYGLGEPHWGSRIAAAFLIPILYRVLWPARNALPTFQRPGDETENWVELVGWTLLGATIALVERLT